MNKPFDSAGLVGQTGGTRADDPDYDITKDLTVGRGAMKKYDEIMAAQAEARDEAALTKEEKRKREEERLDAEKAEQLEYFANQSPEKQKLLKAYNWSKDYGPFVSKREANSRRSSAVRAEGDGARRRGFYPADSAPSGALAVGGKRKRRTRRHKKYNKKSHKKHPKKSHKKRGKSHKKRGKSHKRR